MAADTYSINDLSRLTGLNVRTIRYYLAQGLIPASGESGPGAHYGQGHLDRLRLIKRLQAQYLPNAEIRRRLAPLSDAEVGSLVADAEEQTQEAQTGSALDYIRNLIAPSTETTSPSPGSAPSMPTTAPAAPATPAPPASPSLLRRAFATAKPHDTTAEPHDAPVMPSGTSGEPDASASYPRPALVGLAEDRDVQRAEPTETSPQPERSQWERLTLAENIELHIRRPLSRIEQRRVERLITIARQVLTEDQS